MIHVLPVNGKNEFSENGKFMDDFDIFLNEDQFAVQNELVLLHSISKYHSKGDIVRRLSPESNATTLSVWPQPAVNSQNDTCHSSLVTEIRRFPQQSCVTESYSILHFLL